MVETGEKNQRKFILVETDEKIITHPTGKLHVDVVWCILLKDIHVDINVVLVVLYICLYMYICMQLSLISFMLWCIITKNIFIGYLVFNIKASMTGSHIKPPMEVPTVTTNDLNISPTIIISSLWIILYKGEGAGL